MMHPVFATRRGTRPRGEANLLAIITSKHVSWSNGWVGRSVGRPAGQSRIRGPKVSCLPSLLSYFPKRKKDGRKREKERRSIEQHCKLPYARTSLIRMRESEPPLPLPSLSPANPPLTIRTVEPGPGHQTGPDMPCCAAEPVYVRAGPGAIDRSPQPWDNVRLLSILVQSDTRYTRAYDFPRRFLFHRITAIYIYIYFFSYYFF